MKKALFILILVFLTGCSADKNTEDTNLYKDKSLETNTSTYNESDVMNRIIDLRNGAAAKVKTTKPASDDGQSQVPPVPQTPAQNQMQLEDLAKTYKSALIKTNMGDIKVSFYADVSPVTVNNFMNLAKKGFYDGTKFHRVIKDFMIQGGDPNSKDDDWSNDGLGGPGYKFQDEINDHKLVKGSLAMANSGPNTNGSQFFIVTKDSTPWLDGKHTNFGYVTEGMDVVMKIEGVEANENDHPLSDVVVEKIELLE